MTRNNNPYVHEYWYNSKITRVRTLPSRFYMHYYKRNFYEHETLGIEHTFLIRHRTGEYFPFKTWYMSYNNWIVMSLHWFKPNKKKRILNPMVDHNYLYIKNNLNSKKNLTSVKENRIVLSYAFNKGTSYPANYVF